MARGIYEGGLSDGRRPPQHEDYARERLRYSAYDIVGKSLPPVPLMRGGLMGADSERGVEQQDTLAGPAREVAIWRARATRLLAYLFIYVGKRWRNGYSMVRVLPQDDHFETLRGAGIESIENLTGRWEDLRGGIFRPNKICQRLKIWGVELRLEERLPLW